MDFENIVEKVQQGSTMDEQGLTVDEVKLVPEDLTYVKTKYDDIDVEDIPCRTRPYHLMKCDSCLGNHRNGIRGMCVCFDCENIICVDCLPIHQQYSKCVPVRVTDCTESEKDGIIEKFLEDMENESETEREKALMKEKVILCNWMNVKTRHDKNTCLHIQLCGMTNDRLVVCDSRNYCIKVFALNNDSILRYIQFTAEPYDVTEVILPKGGIKDNAVFGCAFKPSLHYHTLSEGDSLLAVTFPVERQILLLNVDDKDKEVRDKVIKMDKLCYSIDFCNGKLFTVCNEIPEDPLYSVYILSPAGETLDIIITDFMSFCPSISVHPDKNIYLADTRKLQCRHFDGTIMSERAISGSASWISVDVDCNVYLGLHGENCVYRVGSDLHRLERMADILPWYGLKFGGAVGFYREKLFVGGPPTSENGGDTVCVLRIS